jgi:hypothetical protein
MTGRVELGRSADSATNRRDAADFGAVPGDDRQSAPRVLAAVASSAPATLKLRDTRD